MELSSIRVDVLFIPLLIHLINVQISRMPESMPGPRGTKEHRNLVAGLKSAHTGAESRHDLGSTPLLEGRYSRGVHRQEGFKASEGCTGVFQEAKGEDTPGRWDGRNKGLEVALYNVCESTRLISGQSEKILSPECEDEGLGERMKEGPWAGAKGMSGCCRVTTPKASLS